MTKPDLIKPVAEACLRNQQPIAEVLTSLLAECSSLLELGSGTGQHAAYVAKNLPHLSWQTSELEINIAGIEAWRLDARLQNLLPALCVDLRDERWHVADTYEAVFCANTVHFVGWNVVESMLAGIDRHLANGGPCIFYGPYNKDNKFTSEGNERLDSWLKSRDAESGIKDIDVFVEKASEYHLHFEKSIQMPANNLILHFTKTKSA